MGFTTHIAASNNKEVIELIENNCSKSAIDLAIEQKSSLILFSFCGNYDTFINKGEVVYHRYLVEEKLPYKYPGR
jgi:hypothetical protein